MRKKWLILLGMGMVLGGCSSDVGKEESDLKTCTDGDSGVYYCHQNEVCCSGSCLEESNDNCGICGNKCVEGSICDSKSHSCVCESVKGDNKLCSMPMTCTPSDGCVDLKSNKKHCGSINNACEGDSICADGKCSDSCTNEDMTKCPNGCFDLDSSVDACGDCNTKCPTNDGLNHISRSWCAEGECHIYCEAGYDNKDEDISNGCEEKVSFECGNNIIESGEQCDGLKLNDMTCEKLLGEGSTGYLTCSRDCNNFDTTHCSQSDKCGNGRIDGNEVCDGTSLGIASCATVVGAGSEGFLACNSNCSDYDTSYCSAPTNCGNGKIDEGEKCDGSALNDQTCETVVGVGSTGTLKCAENCYDYDRSSCTAASVCGNGILEAGEECDGNNYNGQTCETLVGSGSRGKPSCVGCKITADNCSAASTCGNNIKDGSDVCDGSALNGKTCADVVGEGSTGTLACKTNCSGYDISGCTKAAKCGNGIVEEGEVCDGSRLNDHTCATEVGFGSTGKLTCNKTCTGFVTSGCSASTTCGNGKLEAGEICDTTNLKGATCNSEVGPGSKGTVLCGSDCKSLNLSGCSAATQCGNGKLDEGEVCDGTNLNKATCESVVGAGSTGDLVCGDGCKHFDTTGCSKAKSCGDGAINDNEICDGDNIAGRTCADIVGFGSKGVLKCADNCMDFDTSKCTAEIKCGNGKLDEGEVCDGNMLNGASCSSLVGFGSTGDLKCNSTCTDFDTSACTAKKLCGNGEIDEGEVCDGYNINGRSCVQQVGFGSTGTPACNSTCSGFTNGSCTPAVLCGNGKIDAGEQCDGNVNIPTCESLVGVGSQGKVTCDGNCQYNTTNCTASRGCGNGTIEDGEQCDGTAFVNNIKTCNAYQPSVYASGTLKCGSNCQFDTSACKAFCGNGSVNSTSNGVVIGEACDHNSTTNVDKFPTNANSCAKVVGKGSTGTLVCADDCKSIITNQCTESAYCGDGKINTDDEYCDGNEWLMGTDDCAAWGDYQPGAKVKCLSNCQYDTSACIPKDYCGDGKLDSKGVEECDRDAFLLDMKTCADWDTKYNSGNVKCNNTTCKIDYSDCKTVETKLCGNGKLDGDELCDGTLFDADLKSCADWDPKFTGGTLKCTNCEVDDSACTIEVVEKCGDGIVNGDEVCDGTKFLNNRYSCSTLFPDLYTSGKVTCTSACTYDTSACVSYCGNGSVNTTKGEACDHNATTGVDNFPKASNTCAKVMGTGYTGTLKCSDDCKQIITTGCQEPAVVEKCGDGIVNGDEFCDGTKFLDNKTDCSYWNGNYESGTVGCSNDCEITFDNCKAPAVPECGDGIINQDDEFCDGTALNKDVMPTWNCADYDSKWASGTLTCNSNCEPNESKCVLKQVQTCGNGKLDEDIEEECDMVNGKAKFYGDVSACADYSNNYSKGTLKCSSSCKVDTSGCTLAGCGDGIVQENEFCDGTKFDPDLSTCAKVSSNYSGGTLKCTSDCEIDESGCTKKCGNGRLDDNEYCDGNVFQTSMDTCDDWLPGTTGTLHCNAKCEVDTSLCKAKPTAYCGDGIVNTAAEECDTNAFFADVKNCADYSNKYESGTLTCNKDCTVNESKCKLKYVAKCNDGIFDDDYEECDAGQFLYGIKTCAELSPAYNAGMLKCTNCEIDESGCSFVEVNTCGNGKLDDDEFCDGTKFLDNADNCSDWGTFVSGKVTCTSACDIDTSACIAPAEAKCGDGKINQGYEECDGTEFMFGVTNCKDYSDTYASGKLKCYAASAGDKKCTIDTSSCVKATGSKCGNGVLEGNEECDKTKFMLDIDTCAEYSNSYANSTAKLSCKTDCTIDDSACRASLCPKDETRCAGAGNNELQMCIDGSWQIVYDCNAEGGTCDLENDECKKSDTQLDFSYCIFNYLDPISHRGYGRLLLPSGKTLSDVEGYMYCTNDLSKPVTQWDLVEASYNAGCTNCNSNHEFMTNSGYTGTTTGTYYCTFAFMFDEGEYVCRPKEIDEIATSTPIKVTNTTKLTADLTRSFVKTGCTESDVRCNSNVLEICNDGVWSEMYNCTESGSTCDANAEDCVAAGMSYDNLVTMTGWVTKDNTDYKTVKDQTMADGSKITVTAGFIIGSSTVTKAIDGVTAIFKPASGSKVVISGLTNGLGTISFKYRPYKISDKALLTITTKNGSTTVDTRTVSVDFTVNEIKTAEFAVNSKVATTVEITGENKAGDGRYNLDDIRWTSAP